MKLINQDNNLIYTTDQQQEATMKQPSRQFKYFDGQIVLDKITKAASPVLRLLSLAPLLAQFVPLTSLLLFCFVFI